MPKTPGTGEYVEHWTDTNFDEKVAASHKPVVVDFWAEWCGPCHAMAPVFEAIAKEHGDRYQFVKIDVDTNPDTAEKYTVLAIPTLIIFKDGKVSDQHSGAMTKSQLQQTLGL